MRAFRVILLSLMLCGCHGYLKNANLDRVYTKGITRKKVASHHSYHRPLAVLYIPFSNDWYDLQDDRYGVICAIENSSLASNSQRIRLCEVWWRTHGALGSYYDFVFYDREERVLGYYREVAR